MNYSEIEAKTKMIYNETDSFMSRIKNCCSKGCSYCCHQSIRIVSSEELSITGYLNKHVSAPTKDKIKSQLINWLTYFNKNTPSKVIDENDMRVFQKKIAADKIPCPFLIDGACSIYEARPMVCRTHVVEKDPELCNQNRLRDAVPVAQEYGNYQMTNLLNTAPMNGIRLLPYAVSEYFNLNINLKPVQLLIKLR